MTKVITYLFLILFYSGLTYSQTFTAETGDVYPGDKPTVYTTTLKILSGVIKKGDKIDIYAPTGRKFTATIVSIVNFSDYKPVNQAKAGESMNFTLQFTEDPSTGKDYVTYGYKVYPAGFKVNAKAEKNSDSNANFKATLDGKAFRAKVTSKGAMLALNGYKPYFDRSYLLLQFACIDAPDERLLTIMVFNPKQSVANYTAKDMEVNFSGTADGNKNNTIMFGFVNGKATPNFKLEITKWQASGNNKAIISGKVNGELPEVKLLGKSEKVNRFENGVFENIEVQIIRE